MQNIFFITHTFSFCRSIHGLCLSYRLCFRRVHVLLLHETWNRYQDIYGKFEPGIPRNQEVSDDQSHL